MDTKNILIAGVGGQGTLLTSRIIGNTFLDLGYDVKISEVHGMAQRGGSVVTHVKYGEKVFSPLVEPGGAHILLAFEKMEALRWIHFLNSSGRAIINSQEIEPMSVIMGAYQYPPNLEDEILKICPSAVFLDALDVAKGIGDIKVTNTVLLGVLARYLDIAPQMWEKAIQSTVPSKTVATNIEAFYKGYNSVNV